jgi:transcriptional regulator of acetoin/glycerol metabolism
LRERDDLADIVAELLVHFDALMRGGARATLDELITTEAVHCLTSNRWPGNIRQLEQTVRGLLALRLPPARITLDDLPEAMRVARVPAESSISLPVDARTSPLEAAEEQVIRRVLQQNGGNVSAAARALGISRTTVYAKLRRE